MSEKTSKDLIISGGFNVYPKEVTDAHPTVLDTAVNSPPDGDLGKKVR